MATEYKRDGEWVRALVSAHPGLVQRLEAREREVLLRYYGIGCSKERPKALGRSLGMTPPAVKNLADQAIRRLSRWAERTRPLEPLGHWFATD